MKQLNHYLSLIKFSHTIFALPFALIGFSLGIKSQLNQVFFYSSFPYKTLFFVVVCMVSARSAAMAFNRYLDRRFDALNPRTAIREIPKGIIKPKDALVFTILSSLVFILASFFINAICFYLSPIALFVVLFYSYTKRFTALCHIVLGIGLSLAPIGAYLALTGVFNFLPLLFSFAVLCWVSGFDIIYALQDEGFDKHHQLHSIPVALGKKKALFVSRILHFCSALFIIYAGVIGGFAMVYWLGALAFIVMLIYQQSIVSPTNLTKVNIAFMTANGIASIAFAVITIISIFV